MSMSVKICPVNVLSMSNGRPDMVLNAGIENFLNNIMSSHYKVTFTINNRSIRVTIALSKTL